MPENMKSLNGYGFNASMLNGKTDSEYASAESVSKLKDDLNAEKTARKNADDVLSARMDAFTALPNGSTTGDAELMDIRVATDGATYPSAGDAVRGQIGAIESAIGYVIRDRICAILGTNTDTITLSSSADYKIYNNVVLLANHKYLCYADLTDATQNRVFHIGCIKVSGGTWESSSIAYAKTPGSTIIRGLHTPGVDAYLAFRASDAASATAAIYIYDVTDMADDEINRIPDDVLTGGIIKSVKADTAARAEQADRMFMCELLHSAHVASDPNYFASIGFSAWDFEHAYLFVAANATGLNESHPFGTINASGTWAGFIGNRTVLGDSVYAYGKIPESSIPGVSVQIVMNNQDSVDADVYVYDVTGIDVTDNLVELLLENPEGARAQDIVAVARRGQISASSRWEGKKALVIGDSLTAAGQWQEQLTSLLGMNVTTHAKGGIGLIQCVDGEDGSGEYDSDTAVNGTLYALNTSDVADKDTIILYAGYNNRGTEDGQVGDCYAPDGTGQNTIAGYMQYCINRIYEELRESGNLACHLLIVTVDCSGKYQYIDADGYAEYPSGSGRTMETMANIQKAVANHNAIPCVDLWHNSGINRNTWSIFGAEPDAYYEDTTGRVGTYPHNGDQMHKSAAGYMRIGECVCGGIVKAYGA